MMQRKLVLSVEANDSNGTSFEIALINSISWEQIKSIRLGWIIWLVLLSNHRNRPLEQIRLARRWHICIRMNMNVNIRNTQNVDLKWKIKIILTTYRSAKFAMPTSLLPSTSGPPTVENVSRKVLTFNVF